MDEFLIKIKETNPNFPTAEYLSKLSCCEFVDSISSEKIDGIAKISAGKEMLKELMEKFHFNFEDVERITKTYAFKEEEKDRLSFWISFKVRKNNLPEVEEFMSKQGKIYGAFLTEDSIYIRAGAESIGEVDNLWKNLYEKIGKAIDSRARVKTYFIFNRFSRSG